MSTEKPSHFTCCPPDSDAFLATDYSYIGKITESKSYEFYTIDAKEKTTNGVIVFPDIWGWNGGRTRAIADMIATAGYNVIVPKLMQPALRGGTDGDGLPPDFDFATDYGQFGPYIGSLPWETAIKPRVMEAIAILKSKGVTKIGAIGFCYGGHNMCYAMSDPDTPEVLFGVNPHPSITNIHQIFSNEPIQNFVSKVRGPILFMPAGGDAHDYRKGGIVTETVKANYPDTESIEEFEEVNHGFVPRGDITQPTVKAAVNRVFDHTFAFFAKQFSK